MNTSDVFKELANTKVGDDIDILINLIDQLRDQLQYAVETLKENEIDGYTDYDVDELCEVVCQVPCDDCHRKYWADYTDSELAYAIEQKYENADRLEIPPEFDTCF